MSEPQDFCLRWSSYSQQLSEALRGLLDRELLVDVTLACDGRSLRAHRAILSACSSYFQELFQESTHPHPIVILKDVRYQELEALVKFMYHGEVTVNHDILPGFLRTAETLHVRGLTDNAFSDNTSAISPMKVINGNRRTLEETESLADQEDNSPSVHRLSPVHMKRIKIEQPSTSQYQHPVRLPLHQDMDGGMNSSGADDGNISEQDTHCSLRSDELSHISQDQYAVQRNVSSMDGLSQLVMPVIQDEPHSSQYVGVCGNLQSQHHQLSQPPQQIQHHQVPQQGSNNSGAGGAGRPFRQRVLYNQEQLLQLEAWYRQDRYPSGTLMREYADTLAAMVPNTPGSIGAQPMRQNVDYWFQNRRRKDFHPEVMQQREKKKLAKTLWGSYNGNVIPPSTTNSSDSSTENNVSNNNR